MPKWLFVTLLYLLPLMSILMLYYLKRQRTHRQSHNSLNNAMQQGLTEPASLHPIVDLGKCTGCGACVSACPEKNVLGMIDRQAYLVNPANCIGHGACQTACPQQAITLVFGSSTRGVDIPEVSAEFETNVNGIFIAGELGGMGLIRNAIEQGRQAMDSIAAYLKRSSNPNKHNLDCIIIGSGPAGLSATLGAKSHGLNSLTIDQDQPGGTVSHFPRGKLVMTQPANMPLVGKVKFGEISKEKLMQFWLKIIDDHQIKIQQNETLISINKTKNDLFEVNTSVSQYLCRSVLLAIGRRGSPRKLGVPGEEKSKVVYRLTDPEQYLSCAVLVVGGGDSALEAACSIAELGNKRVTLSYRKDSFSGAKPKNREKINQFEQSGKLKILYSSQVIGIDNNQVEILQDDHISSLENDIVIVCVGGVLPTQLLKDVGINISTKFGTE